MPFATLGAMATVWRSRRTSKSKLILSYSAIILALWCCCLVVGAVFVASEW
jgi:hypothetical protein